MGRTRYVSKTESTLFSSIHVWSWWKEGAKNGIVVWAGETVSSDYYGGRGGGGHLQEQSRGGKSWLWALLIPR